MKPKTKNKKTIKSKHIHNFQKTQIWTYELHTEPGIAMSSDFIVNS
jgi:hypothetical protein